MEASTTHHPDQEHLFREIYLAYWDTLYRIANRKIGYAQDAMDIVQDTFTYVWQQFPMLQLETAGAKPFLITCLYYRIFGFLRARGLNEKHLQHFQTYLENELHTDPVYSAQDAAAELEAVNIAIMGALDRMPERMKQIFVLSRYENKSIEEIAHIYAIAPKTVKNQLSEAMRRLKDMAGSYPATALLPVILLLLEDGWGR
ncbi:sigma-70 family RNA polymerase sigma factor [Chitinophaga varians]|uniref:Sigma-70 family RNA polymerase sigma factor n=1 Tax=Chitinophaga varians TaxID=2202339 RepID=A0A847S3K0_9BACT|nr:sigma-70 family RNA polymerase sigma factor [Chitinophaga varians]NLR67678.1 sigma-70 family RNA polymerase sigma factor [Chitinophaga varians]